MHRSERAKPGAAGKRLAALPAVLAMAALLCAACDGPAQPPGGAADIARPRGTPPRTLAIQAMTTIGADGTGYFADPHPLRLAPFRSGRTQAFSGTTEAIMSCAHPVSARCFSWTRAAIDAGTLRARIAAAGASITNFQNLDLFQDDASRWHAVLAIGVNSPAHPAYWTVLVHAHPPADAAPGAVPLAWSADTVLSGSFSEPADGNYDGKYFEDKGRLYLLYVRNFAPRPALRNGIVIQPMLSPARPAPEGPTTLLMPGDGYGALDSEAYHHALVKLVEAPHLVRIVGKYALIYSTGAYWKADYKAGVAWSDTLMPAQGGRYRKVLEPDVQGVWGQPGRPEVRYLLQSQRPLWPNFTGDQVISPGVASAVQKPGGAWCLYFAGFDPADWPPVPPGAAQADHRRPFFVRLRAAVPPSQPVSAASDAELATWLQPEAQQVDSRP